MKTKIVTSVLFVGLLSSCATTDKVASTRVYTLIAVNGARIPTTTRHGSRPLVVQSGTFTISSDGTCRSEMIFGPRPESMQRRVVNATCTLEGSELTIKWKGAGRAKGVFEGDFFTMNNEGMVFEYQRRS